MNLWNVIKYKDSRKCKKIYPALVLQLLWKSRATAHGNKAYINTFYKTMDLPTLIDLSGFYFEIFGKRRYIKVSEPAKF